MPSTAARALPTASTTVFGPSVKSPATQTLAGESGEDAEIRFLTDGGHKDVARDLVVGAVQDLRDELSRLGIGLIPAVAEDDIAVPHLDRCLEDAEAHAVGLGLLDLHRVSGHVLEGLAVVDPGLGAAADRCPAGIHGDIAAADDDDPLALEGIRTGILEIMQGLDHTGLVLAGNTQQRGLFRTGGDENGVVVAAKVIQQDIFPKRLPAEEADAGHVENLLVDVDKFLIQTESRDAVAQHAAHPRIGVIEIDVRARAVEPDGRGDARRPGPHDRDALAADRPHGQAVG